MRKFIKIINESFLVQEAPISDITNLGNWDKNSGYRDQDRKLLTNPKAVKKIQTMWKYPEEVDCNILLFNGPEGSRYSELGKIGKVGGTADEWLRKKMPKNAEAIIAALKPNEVNILFTNNKGSEAVPMTGWVMAHRFGHVLNRNFTREYSYFEEATKTLDSYLTQLAELYNLRPNSNFGQKMLASTNTKGLLTAICTFKSARENNLRTTYEAVYEMFAQYIITGNIKFNEAPATIKVGRSYHVLKKDGARDANMILDDMSSELVGYFETAIYHTVGNVYLM